MTIDPVAATRASYEQVALDYQEALNSAAGQALAPPTQSKVFYAHFIVNF